MSTISLMSKAKSPNPAGRIDKREVRCPCGTSCNDTDTYLEHKRGCKIHTELQITTSNSKRKPSGTVAKRSNSRFARSTMYSSTVVATKKDKQCPCGERFTNDMQLASHLRYARAHRGKSASVPNTKAAAPQMLSSPPARKETTDASLVASLAGLKLDSVEAQVKPSVGPCNRGGGIRDKKFNTPRPPYQKEEYLEECVALSKLQYASATYIKEVTQKGIIE